jgi:hypothetical protein
MKKITSGTSIENPVAGERALLALVGQVLGYHATYPRYGEV